MEIKDKNRSKFNLKTCRLQALNTRKSTSVQKLIKKKTKYSSVMQIDGKRTVGSGTKKNISLAFRGSFPLFCLQSLTGFSKVQYVYIECRLYSLRFIQNAYIN